MLLFSPVQVVLAALLAVSHGAPAAPAGYAPAPYEAYPDIAPSYNVSNAPECLCYPIPCSQMDVYCS